MPIRMDERKMVPRRLRMAIDSRTVAIMGFLVLVIGLGGCQRATRPLFAHDGPALVWPPDPLPPKIRHIGELRGTVDLQTSRSGFESLADFFVGAPPNEILYGPRAVLSLADKDCLWVADPGGRCLHFFDLGRRKYAKITRVGASRLLMPVGLSRGPEGSIYTCDSELGAIFRLSDRTGELLDEVTLSEVLQRPVAVHYDPAREELFVVDSLAHNIKVLGPDKSVRRIIGRRGLAPGEFNFPLAVTADEEMIWVVDTGNQRIQGLSRSGEPLAIIGGEGDTPGHLTLPKGIALDSQGHVYVVDGRFENVQVFDKQGRLLLFFGEEGSGPGEFWLPTGIDIDANDRIWICDSYNRRLQVFDYVRSKPDEEQAEQPRERQVRAASVAE